MAYFKFNGPVSILVTLYVAENYEASMPEAAANNHLLKVDK